jgi:carboxymethylenebutenolidase
MDTSGDASIQAVARQTGRSRGERVGVMLAGALAAAAVSFAAYEWWPGDAPTSRLGTQQTTTLKGFGPQEEVFEGVRQSLGKYKSSGKEIRIERYLPLKSGRYPAIIVLHGGGPAVNPGGNTLQFRCREFARDGYVALMPLYFDQTDTAFADPPTIDRLFVTWMGTINQAIEYARRQPEVDPERIGLIGWSLGSALALEVAATNPHSTAVVGNIGGMAKEILDKMTRMPPTLLLDGENDKNYPAAMARDLYRTLRRKHVVVESKIYPGQGHGFSGEAALDATRRTNEFFRKYLAKTPEIESANPPGQSLNSTK